MTALFDWSLIPAVDQRRTLDVIGNDGHTIYSVAYLQRHNMPATVILGFLDDIESNPGDVKSTVFVNDVPVDSMRGVYGLEVIESLAHYYHIRSDKSGRGFRARDLTEQLFQLLRDAHP